MNKIIALALLGLCVAVYAQRPGEHHRPGPHLNVTRECMDQIFAACGRPGNSTDDRTKFQACVSSSSSVTSSCKTEFSSAVAAAKSCQDAVTKLCGTPSSDPVAFRECIKKNKDSIPQECHRGPNREEAQPEGQRHGPFSQECAQAIESACGKPAERTKAALDKVIECASASSAVSDACKLEIATFQKCEALVTQLCGDPSSTDKGTFRTCLKNNKDKLESCRSSQTVVA